MGIVNTKVSDHKKLKNAIPAINKWIFSLADYKAAERKAAEHAELNSAILFWILLCFLAGYRSCFGFCFVFWHQSD